MRAIIREAQLGRYQIIMKKLIISHEEADIISIQTLTFIASDPAQLERLAINTGVSAKGPRQRAGTSEILLACLKKILKTEPDLPLFCTNSNTPLERVQIAEAVLDGTIRDAE